MNKKFTFLDYYFLISLQRFKDEEDTAAKRPKVQRQRICGTTKAVAVRLLLIEQLCVFWSVTRRASHALPTKVTKRHFTTRQRMVAGATEELIDWVNERRKTYLKNLLIDNWMVADNVLWICVKISMEKHYIALLWQRLKRCWIRRRRGNGWFYWGHSTFGRNCSPGSKDEHKFWVWRNQKSTERKYMMNEIWVKTKRDPKHGLGDGYITCWCNGPLEDYSYVRHVGLLRSIDSEIHISILDWEILM